MPKTRKVGPAGSLGARYGTVARRRYTSIITELRAPKPCPKCQRLGVHRESVGIWICRKCGYKFTGGAYIPQTKLGQISQRGVRIAPTAVTAEAVASAAPESVAEEKPKRRPRRRRTKQEETAQEQPSSQEEPH